jgi:hypothetical protein
MLSDDELLKKKRSKEEERLEIMDRKLKAMENLIVEDTAQYFSQHGGSKTFKCFEESF